MLHDRTGSILPNCFSPLISLKTVNEQRERKFGELFWLSNDRHSVGLVRRQAVSRPYLSPMIAAAFPICITALHSKLCRTTKKLCLCILPQLCSNVSQTLFHVGLRLSRAVCTFHQQTRTHTQKKLPIVCVCSLPARPEAALKNCPSHCIWPESWVLHLNKNPSHPAFPSHHLERVDKSRGFGAFFYSWWESSEMHARYQCYATSTQGHKGRAEELRFKTAFQCY